jgi:hypothetical protein
MLVFGQIEKGINFMFDVPMWEAVASYGLETRPIPFKLGAMNLIVVKKHGKEGGDLFLIFPAAIHQTGSSATAIQKRSSPFCSFLFLFVTLPSVK